MTKTITIANEKGGVGKTTTAQHLAIGLAKKGFKVLAIDLDSQRNLSSTFGDMGQTQIKRVYDLMNGEPIQNCIYNTKQGIHIIYGDDRIANADKVFTEPNRPYLLNEQLQNIKSRYDYVIIDTPPRSKSVAVINAMTTSDEVIIPMQANSFSIEGLQKILETFEMVKKYTNHNIKVLGILMTMYEDRTLFRRGITKQMENLSTKIQIPLFKTTIRRGIAMEEAQSQKTNIFEYNMKSNVAKDYQDFIDEVIKKEKELDSKMNESEAK